MFIYVYIGKKCEQVISVTNFTEKEIAAEIIEIKDKWGDDAIVLLSQQNVTDPVKELILGEDLIEV